MLRLQPQGLYLKFVLFLKLPFLESIFSCSLVGYFEGKIIKSYGTLEGKIAKELFEIVWEKGGNPKDIVKEKGMTQVTDVGAIEAEVDKIINENPDQVEKAKTNPKLAGWFVGQVLKATSGKANPAVVSKLINKKKFISNLFSSVTDIFNSGVEKDFGKSSKISEIDDAVEAVKSTGNNNLVLLHCNSSYPSTYAEVNLKFMDTLKKMYNIPVGFSDHTTDLLYNVSYS